MATNRAIGYIRPSTAKQHLSPDVQKTQIVAYAKMKGLDVIGFKVDLETSSTIPFGERPNGAELVKMLKRGEASHVIVSSLCRAFRNVQEAWQVVPKWEKAGVTLHVCNWMGAAVDTNSSTGRLMFGVFAAVLDWEHSVIKERTAAALLEKRKLGLRFSGEPPYGYRMILDGTRTRKQDGIEVPNWILEEDPREKKIIETVVKLRSDGYSWTQLVAKINSMGAEYAAREGKKWGERQLYRLVKRHAPHLIKVALGRL